MKKAILLLLLLLSVGITHSLAGKKKTRKIMNTWIDQPKHSLILSWGPPDRVTDDGAGGTVLIYAQARSINGYYMLQTWIPGRTWYDYKIFFVNKDGIIYGWRTESKDVPPQQLNINGNIDIHNY